MMNILSKTIRALIVATSIAFSFAGASAMNNDDVLKMAGAGLSDDIVVNAIKTAETGDFDVSADALIRLKEEDVSDAVIQAMQTRARGGARVDDDPGPGAGTIDYEDVPDEEVLPPTITPEVGGSYFTRYTCKFEKGEHVATNYWRGELLPINTEVELIGIKGDSFTLRISDSPKTIEFENVPKYTKRDLAQLMEEFLSDEPTAIEKYGDDMARFIHTGTVRLGMTKTQVLLARGYPPAHETSTLELDAWKYWSSRFVVQTLVFDRGILIQGRGLH
ncbi:MAG: hypothetical protein ACREIA_02065 [Opitutaceae bacterium]